RGVLPIKKRMGGPIGLARRPPQAAAIAAPAQNISHDRRYAHGFSAPPDLYRHHPCVPRGWRSAPYTTSVRPSVAPAHASVPRDGGLHPLLCLDEPRIAQRCGLCRHAGGLSGCGAGRRAISVEPVSHSGMDRCAKNATCEGPEQIDLAALAGELLQNCTRHFQVMHCPSELTRAVLWFPGLRLPASDVTSQIPLKSTQCGALSIGEKLEMRQNLQSQNCLNALKPLALPREVDKLSR